MLKISINHVLENVYRICINNFIRKCVPGVNSSVREKLMVLSGISIIFLEFVGVVSGVRKYSRREERLSG